jgi:hypothetical protein
MRTILLAAMSLCICSHGAWAEPQHAAGDRAHEIAIKYRNNAAKKLATVDVRNPMASPAAIEHVDKLTTEKYLIDAEASGYKELIEEEAQNIR